MTPTLNNTALVILGLLLQTGEKTGYELKALVDRSTQNFWPASYGRIYPELRRLREDGLVTSRDEPQGERPRTVYDLTEQGRAAIAAWLDDEPETLTFELRDEGVLRLFLAAHAPPEARLRTIRAMRAHHEQIARRLRTLQADVGDIHGDTFPPIMLEGGIAFHEWYVAWCDDLEKRFAAAE